MVLAFTMAFIKILAPQNEDGNIPIYRTFQQLEPTKEKTANLQETENNLINLKNENVSHDDTNEPESITQEPVIGKHKKIILHQIEFEKQEQKMDYIEKKRISFDTCFASISSKRQHKLEQHVISEFKSKSLDIFFNIECRQNICRIDTNLDNTILTENLFNNKRTLDKRFSGFLHDVKENIVYFHTSKNLSFNECRKEMRMRLSDK